MPKRLAEALVVEPQLNRQIVETRNDLLKTFSSKRHLFEEKRKVFQPIEEGAAARIEEQSDIQSTVEEELGWVSALWTKSLDASFVVAEGNTTARADVVLDGNQTLLTNVPATFLLELDHRMKELQDLITAAPTLDPAKGFTVDAARGRGIYQARTVTRVRTKKVKDRVVLHEGNDKHPPQVQLVDTDVPSGTATEQEWSAMLTPARKSILLDRVEELRRALKAALQRANAVELTASPKCGKAIFDFVLAP